MDNLISLRDIQLQNIGREIDIGSLKDYAFSNLTKGWRYQNVETILNAVQDRYYGSNSIDSYLLLREIALLDGDEEHMRVASRDSLGSSGFLWLRDIWNANMRFHKDTEATLGYLLINSGMVTYGTSNNVTEANDNSDLTDDTYSSGNPEENPISINFDEPTEGF